MSTTTNLPPRPPRSPSRQPTFSIQPRSPLYPVPMSSSTSSSTETNHTASPHRLSKVSSYSTHSQLSALSVQSYPSTTEPSTPPRTPSIATVESAGSKDIGGRIPEIVIEAEAGGSTRLSPRSSPDSAQQRSPSAGHSRTRRVSGTKTEISLARVELDDEQDLSMVNWGRRASDGGLEGVAGTSSRTEGVRRTGSRSSGRTRTWAEEVARQKRKTERSAEKERREREKNLKLAERGVGPLASSPWNMSTEVIDSLLEQLNPPSPPDLPSASKVIARLARKSLSTKDDLGDSSASSSSASDSDVQSPTRSMRSTRTPPKRLGQRRGQESLHPIDIKRASPSADTPKRYGSRSHTPENCLPLSPSTRTLSPASPMSSTFSESEKPPIMSIDDIVKKHSAAMNSAYDKARDKARLEIEQDRRPSDATLSGSPLTGRSSMSTTHENSATNSPGPSTGRLMSSRPNMLSSPPMSPSSFSPSKVSMDARPSDLDVPDPTASSPQKKATPHRRHHRKLPNGADSPIIPPRVSSSPQSPDVASFESNSIGFPAVPRSNLSHSTTSANSSLSSKSAARRVKIIPPRTTSQSPIATSSSTNTSLASVAVPPQNRLRREVTAPKQNSTEVKSASIPRSKPTFTDSPGVGRSEPDEASSGESLMKSLIAGQALLDRLEQGSLTSSPSTRHAATFSPGQTHMDLDALSINTPDSSNISRLDGKTSRSGRALSPTSQATAMYLRSPHLNRYMSIPRPYPDPPVLQVSLAEVGSPTGYPVLLFPGLGCVRYMIALFDDLAKALDLRLICVDRWGYGRTDAVPVERRGPLQWAQVIETVLERLEIDEFRVIAHSAGAPFAAAVALRLGERVKGMLHFLAPWVSPEIDGGYKWLKWVPNGIIKGATAAEWRYQTYKLGKPPPLIHSPVSHLSESLSRPSQDSLGPLRPPFDRAVSESGRSRFGQLRSPKTSIDSPYRAMSSGSRSGTPGPTDSSIDLSAEKSGRRTPAALIKRASNVFRSESPSDRSGRGSPVPKGLGGGTMLRTQPEDGFRERKGSKSTFTNPFASPSTSKGNVISPASARSNHLSSPRPLRSDSAPSTFSPSPLPITPEHQYGIDSRNSVDTTPEPVHIGRDEDEAWEYLADTPTRALGFDVTPVSSPHYMNSSAPSLQQQARSSPMSFEPIFSESFKPPTGPALMIALLQASHAECEPGTTTELLSIVLQRPGLPWGFSYQDIIQPTLIQWGEEDDKVSEKSVRWMERCMTKGGAEVKVIEGEGHNLLTSAEVMCDVFQMIRREVKEDRLAREKGKLTSLVRLAEKWRT